MEVSETMFDNREKLENFVLFGPVGHNFEISEEKMTEIVSYFVIIFDELSNIFSVFLFDQ